MGFWDGINKLFGRSQLMDLVVQNNTNQAIYPDTKAKYMVDTYSTNCDVFSVINKIAEPAARVPILQVNKKTQEEQPGFATEKLNRPNPFQSQTEFIEAGLKFHLTFGETFIACERPEFGLNAGKPTRLDNLPPQWVELLIGDFFNPISGYTFTVGQSEIKYDVRDVLHWKDFNPNYDLSGSHLRGMSRLRPLLRAVASSNSGYDSMVASFQNQGAYGLLTILGVKEDDGKYSNQPKTAEQLSKLEQSFRHKMFGNSNRGKLAATNKSVEYTNFGLSPVDLNILKSIGITKGVIYDAYNYPDILASGSEGRTYQNYSEAMKAAWNNAIIPMLDGYLAKLNAWLMPLFGEEDTMFIADYDSIPALQDDKKALIEWMTKAGLTTDEIREAIGYDPMRLPNMNIPLVPLGLQRIDEIGLAPEQPVTEEVLKRLKIADYRENLSR